jgi:hypothetical protein
VWMDRIALPRNDAVRNKNLLEVGHGRNASACGHDYAPDNSKQQVLQSFDGDLVRIVSPCYAQNLRRERRT